MSSESTTRSAFRSVSVTEAELAHQASLLKNCGDHLLELLAFNHSIAVRLFSNVKHLEKDLSTEKTNNGPSSSDEKKAPETKPIKPTQPVKLIQPKVRALYRDVILQEQKSTGSTEEKPSCSKQTVQIISGMNYVPKVAPFSKAKEENYSQSFNKQVQQKSGMKQSKDSTKIKKKQTQTKNMVKNFSKSIFSFIKKNKELRQMVLRSFAVDEQEFMKVFTQFKGQINSIAELRQLWIEGGNNYDKVFRILSFHYLRRGCFERTFNSRVQNYRVHLKYRKVLLEGLLAPQQFTVMKTNQIA